MELLDQIPVKRKKLNIKKEIRKYLRNWYWILLSMFLFYIAAKIYLRYTQEQYLSKTTLQFPESKAKGNATALNDLQTLGTGLSGNNELQAETTAIISKPILAKVAEQLGLNVSYYGLGKIIEPELYNATPYETKILSIDNDRWGGSGYILTPTGQHTYKLSEGPLLKGKNSFRFGVPAELPFGRIQINVKAGSRPVPLKINFRNTKNVVSSVERSVVVSLPENKGLLMDLSITGPVPEKSEAILNEITRQYNIEGVKDRTEEAQNTQNFINERLAIITDDLSGIEGQKERFKKNNQITDLDAQANMALNNSNDNTKQLLTYSTQLDLVNSIFNATTGEKLVPSNMGLSAATEGYISKYNDLLLQKNKTLKQATYANPSVIQLNKEIDEYKGLIRKNLLESRETLQLQIAQVRGQLNADQSRIENYPTQEKVFRSIERQQNLKEQLYLYLLQKREENAITLAVTAPKAKVLNPAYTVGKVKPDTQKITLGALLAGLLLPIAFLYGKYSLDTRVQTKDQVIAHIPEASVIAEIPENEEQTTVAAGDFSLFAESFRILSSNLKFILKAKKGGSSHSGVILVTSTVKGEGKTTVAMNTALTLAGSAKVLIIGADIRNPQLQRFVKEKKEGLTNYLISDSQDVEHYIVPSGLNQNLEVLFSGAIAPNPNDLLDMQKFDDLISAMRKKYDYIVLDSAPVMLVSDTLHLIEDVDMILYVVKSGFTENDMLDFAAEFKASNANTPIAYVLNNVKLENSRYGKKYGYGYYTQREKNGWRKVF